MIKGRFIQRKNRFVALVDVNGEIFPAHVANSGRLKELLLPGNEVFLIKRNSPHRATPYDLALVKYRDRLVSVDARLPNGLVRDAVNRGELLEFEGYNVARCEVKYGNSRLDMLLEDAAHNRCYVEVKSCTLVDDTGTARFPDAPTGRGRRHLQELAAAVGQGHRGVVVFLVQREDAGIFSPNDTTDPDFGDTLRNVVRIGVEAYAYVCRIDYAEIRISGRIPVLL